MQRTLKKRIEIEKTDIPSGNSCKVIVEPSCERTGIIFKTPREQIPASLNNARAVTFPCKTIVLFGEKDRIAVPEHILAQLYAYGVDNAVVSLEKTPSLTSYAFKYFGSARHTQFVPYLDNDLCLALEGNTREQDSPRRTLRLEEKISSKDGRLSINPINAQGIRIAMSTSYQLSDGPIMQQKDLEITPEAIKEISTARNYCGTIPGAPRCLTKAVACLFYLSQGFGNGNNPTNTFYPVRTKEQWRKQEIMEAEIACHSIIDRLGELALLPGRVEGVYVESFKAGHKDTIDFLKEYQHEFMSA